MTSAIPVTTLNSTFYDVAIDLRCSVFPAVLVAAKRIRSRRRRVAGDRVVQAVLSR
jgi:hypothetical protein